MEIDIAALQRLPEVTEAAGLDLAPKPKCYPNSGTKVFCSSPSCSSTIVVVGTPPGQ
jgi:hypothetical protein